MPKKHVKDDFVICVTFAKGIVQKFFEIPENFCIPARNFLQSLMNRMVKTVFENSIFLPLKSAFNFVTMEVYMGGIF